MRRVEEEMRKRERMEADRKDREAKISEQQAEDERKAIEECERYERDRTLTRAIFISYLFIEIIVPKIIYLTLHNTRI